MTFLGWTGDKIFNFIFRSQHHFQHVIGGGEAMYMEKTTLKHFMEKTTFKHFMEKTTLTHFMEKTTLKHFIT